MARAGRDKELVVKGLERLLANAEVEIESPSFVIGVNSKTRREIDIALRSTIDSVNTLVMIEVRDRHAIENVNWIEQIATKRDDVHAASAIAVSTSSFSTGARNSAAHYNIELRTLKELTTTGVMQWFQPTHLTEINRQVHISSHFFFVDQSTSAEVRQAIRSDYSELDPNAPIFVRLTGNGEELVSLNQVWLGFVADNPSIYEDIEPNTGLSKSERFNLTYPPDDRYQLKTSKGVAVVHNIVLTVEMGIARTEVPVEKRTQYANQDGDNFVESVHFVTDAGGTAIELGIHKVDDGTPRLVVTSSKRTTTSDKPNRKSSRSSRRAKD